MYIVLQSETAVVPALVQCQGVVDRLRSSRHLMGNRQRHTVEIETQSPGTRSVDWSRTRSHSLRREYVVVLPLLC